MHRRHRTTTTWRTAAAAALALSLVAPAAAAAQPAEPTAAFETSFEPGQPQPDWTSTAETTPAGEPRMAGVTGSPATGIPGNVTGRVTEVRASAENPPSEGAAQLIDGNVTTKWLAFASTARADLRFDEPVAVVHYALTSANDVPNRDPRDWTLQGSQDGTTWTDLDRQTGQTFDSRFQTREYRFENTTAYRWYRLDVTAIRSGSTFQLAELQLSDGDTTPPPATPMRTDLSGGPVNGFTMRPNAGFTGQRALQYSGGQTADRGYAYNKVLDVDIPVTARTELSYLVFPELTAGDLDYPSTQVALDLAFDDGTYLSDLGARDQHGFELTPAAQGASKSLYADQWNRKASVIGEVAAGKRITRILVGYDSPTGEGLFNGWIDDVRIGDAPEAVATGHPSDHVITTRGTNSSSGFSRGNTIPATAVPHGFNFWTPMTDAGSTSFLYEYQRANNADNLPTVQAFTASHAPSPWMGDRQTFQVLPSQSTPTTNRASRALPFRHADEVAKPHHYAVEFTNGMRTEIAPTDHAAMFRFTYTADTSYLLFDNVNSNGGLSVGRDGVVTGYSDVRSGLSNGATRMFFYAEVDAPVRNAVKPTSGTRSNVFGHLELDTSAQKVVTMRIASSLISLDQAKRNLELEIAADDTFEAVRDRAQRLWDDKLSVVEVEGATPDQLTTLYSNLYRLFLYPNSAHENVGTAAAPVWKHAVQSSTGSPSPAGTATETAAPVADGKVYVNNGFWDTYRTTWSAYSLLSPGQAAEMVDGFVQQYRDGGWVSRWSSPGYANLMTGTSSDVSFADAYVKGVRGFDARDAYDAALKNATVAPPGNPNNSSVGRKGLEHSVFKGYTSTAVHEGLSWHLEGNLNDFGIANMAAAMARDEDLTAAERRRLDEESEYFRERATKYATMFDPSVGFFQGRDADGSWRVPADRYDPRVWGHDYTETNGWNFAFHAPQDGQGLANLYGGRDELAEKLDEFFSTPETGEHPGSYGGIIHEIREARDARYGQWGISNQVSHHIPHMYTYAGRPDRAQEVLREALGRSFLGSEIGQGYAGDEDNGEVSAWWLFNALGFYPLQVGSQDYVIGSPLFTKATVHLENGRDLVINAPDNSRENIYVQGLRIDGKPWTSTSLPHDVIADGAVLDFAMGPEPSTWATAEADLPTSLTTGDEAPAPLRDVTGVRAGTGIGSGAVPSDGLLLGSLHERVTGVRASGENPPNETAARAVDGNLGTKWLTFASTGWLEVDLDEPQTVVRYALTSGNDAPERDPRDWTLQGSDDGTTWVTLDTRVDQGFSERNQTVEYALEGAAAYRHYRLDVTRVNGGPLLQLTELQLSDGSVPAGDTDVSALFDDTSGTRLQFVGKQPWVQRDFTDRAQELVRYYTITSGHVPGDARDWVLEGSYDGETWSVIDRREGEAFDWRLQTRPFRIAKPGRYHHYRLEVTANSGEPTTTLAELELLANPRPTCTSTVEGAHDGPLRVTAGVVCVEEATVTGPVTVAAGASLLVRDARITGPVTATGAEAVVITGSHVEGPVTLTGTRGEASVEDSRVVGPLRVEQGRGRSVVAGSTVEGPLRCSGNDPAPVSNGLANRVTGPKAGQCADL